MSRTEPDAGNRGVQPGVVGLPIATPGDIVHPARKDNDDLAGFQSHRPRDALDATVAPGAGTGASPKYEVAGKPASTGEARYHANAIRRSRSQPSHCASRVPG